MYIFLFLAAIGTVASVLPRWFRMVMENRAGKPFSAVVETIVDGDTIDVRPEGGSHSIRLRLRHIDAPEIGQEHGDESAAALNSLRGSVVTVVPYSRDVYGRLLAEVGINGQSVNLGQVRYGMAWATNGAPWHFKRAMHAAQREELGLWGGLTTMAPWEFRARSSANA